MSPPPADSDETVARSRLVQVFEYLKALHEHRNPVVRQVGEYPWTLRLQDLPVHESVTRGWLEAASEPEALPESEPEPEAANAGPFLLRVRRPTLRGAPIPPEALRGWIEGEWKTPSASLRLRPPPALEPAPEDESTEEAERRAERQREREEGQRERQAEFHHWHEDSWMPWARAERPAHAAMKVFNDLYDLHSRLQREGERLEVVVGDGLLVWRAGTGGVRHPVLLQRVQLEFNADVPEFTLSDADHPVELYTGVSQAIPSLDPVILVECREELERAPVHPLSGSAADEYLRRMVNRLSPTDGEFVGDRPLQGETDAPRIARDPYVFLRSRALGFGQAIERVLEDLKTREDLPKPIVGAVGVEAAHPEGGSGAGEDHAEWEEPAEVLLSKPANPEQVRIARRLESSWNVLVQGPPGTGKTHTIANLLGHLLAQGKSVLVTSHTTKALRVLRQQVVDALQPLCVSVLDSDADSRQELEDSVRAIVERLGSADADRLRKDAEQLVTERAHILDQLRKTRAELLHARHDEYQSVVVAGQGYSPSDAARMVRSDAGEHGWIPGPVDLGAPLPLSPEDVAELYRTNRTVTPEDERELGYHLPAPEAVLSPDRFGAVVSGLRELEQQDLSVRADLWRADADAGADQLQSLVDRLREATTGLEELAEWKLEAISAGASERGERRLWGELITEIEAVRDQAVASREMIVRYGPEISSAEPLENQVSILGEIVAHMQGGGGLSWASLLLHRPWKRMIETCSVAGSPPSTVDHYQALQQLATLRLARVRLAGRWDRQMAPLGAPDSRNLGEEMERTAERFVPQLQRALNWYPAEWRVLEEELVAAGFRWSALLAEQEPRLDRHGDLLRLRDAAHAVLPAVLQSRIQRQQHAGLQDSLMTLLDHLSGFRDTAVVEHLRRAVRERQHQQYDEAFARLVELHERSKHLRRRRELLTRLSGAAPAWANAIEERHGRHGDAAVPGDAARAWLWRQLHDELERRGRVSLEALQEKVSDLSSQLRRVTAELIDRRAWEAQVRRTTLKQQQALMGYRGVVRKIGKGTGVRAPRLKAEAQRLMAECRSAVPVWIMPLSRVADTFDPRTTRFDVIIIDEASQCDMMGLLAMYLGRKVVVVGDDEQVSPDAVGQRVDEVERLISLHLRGIPNSLLYDGQRSIYDLANESFGSPIRLVEHFRCVPEIIQFSNTLSYGGTIKPLRDASSVRLRPHTVAHRVGGALYDERSKTNREEAETIASLVAAAIREPEYENATFGVISLLGDKQALLIEQALRTRLTPREYTKHRVLCGNASQFQGDERDVMFLSLVHGPADGGPLRLVNEGPQFATKKRFNVAASRARDQLWVVHSMDPATDLKPDDLRLRLIRHVQDPNAVQRNVERAAQAAESPFEREVQQRLISAGYDVVPQWKVGAYRIDMVVQDGNKRLAIECDGDRFHPMEALAADMQRQAILERLGWTFARIRGSQFFRDPEAAMVPVFERLHALGIAPQHGGEAAPPMQSDDELLERVRRGAAELRRERRGESAASGPGATGPHGEEAEQGESRSAKAPGLPPSLAEPASDPVEGEGTTTGVETGPDLHRADPEDAPVPAAVTSSRGDHTIPRIHVRLALAGVRPYERAPCPFGAPAPDRFTSDMDVLRSIFYVVEREAPIHVDATIRRTAEFFGFQRVGSQVRQRLDAGVGRLVRASRVVLRDGFLWLPGQGVDGLPVRIPGEGPVRPVEEIALEELTAAVRLLSAESSASEDLVVRVARLFGFQRTGWKVQERIGGAIQLMRTPPLQADESSR